MSVDVRKPEGKLIYLVKNTSVARSVVKKLTTGPMKPGTIIPLTAEEFDVFKNDIICMEIPDEVE